MKSRQRASPAGEQPPQRDAVAGAHSAEPPAVTQPSQGSATGADRTPITAYRTLHLLLTAVSVVLILLTVNRRTTLTLPFVAPNEFLRWTDLNNMLLGMVTVLLYYALNAHLTGAAGSRRTGFSLHAPVFALASYLYACSYGIHEVTNYLNARFCGGRISDACRIIDFNDNAFSHYLFFGGFILLNVSVVLAQFDSPATAPLTRWDNALLVANASVIAGGIAANLAFERTGIDLYVVVVVAVLTLLAARRLPGQPVLRYYNVGYGGGVVLAVVLTATS